MRRTSASPHLARLGRFFSAPCKRWESTLIRVRIVLVVALVIGTFPLLNSSLAQHAGMVFWGCFFLLLASIVYQFGRRWNETKNPEDPG
jgi:hypothetical protein